MQFDFSSHPAGTTWPLLQQRKESTFTWQELGYDRGSKVHASKKSSLTPNQTREESDSETERREEKRREREREREREEMQKTVVKAKRKTKKSYTKKTGR